MPLKRIYLDVCALCRPFDDQCFVRIRMESDAVSLILQRVREGSFELSCSTVHTREILAISEQTERIELLGILASLGNHIVPIEPLAVRARADYFVSCCIGVADAAHLAFAESVKAHFITCDDRLLRKCRTIGSTIWFGDPLEFCLKENIK